jgi:hypothetical protein
MDCSIAKLNTDISQLVEKYVPRTMDRIVM